jgi:hypothetical protein
MSSDAILCLSAVNLTLERRQIAATHIYHPKVFSLRPVVRVLQLVTIHVRYNISIWQSNRTRIVSSSILCN